MNALGLEFQKWAAFVNRVFFLSSYIKSTMTGVQGRPAGSKDRKPRKKRSKLQFMVDQHIGHTAAGKKDIHVEVQHPCETCGSCVRVQFKYPEKGGPRAPFFMTQPLYSHLSAAPLPK